MKAAYTDSKKFNSKSLDKINRNFKRQNILND